MKNKLFLLVILLICGACSCSTKKAVTIPIMAVTSTKTEELQITHNKAELLAEYNVTLDTGTGICAATIVKTDTAVSYFLTAYHCVEDTDNLRIILNNRSRYRVRVVRKHETYDLALLINSELIPELLTPAKISKKIPAVGDTIYMIGSGGGIENILSKGIFSLRRDVGTFAMPWMNVLDITGYFGNSGGGVFNEDLELIGVLSMLITNTGWMMSIDIEKVVSFLNFRIGEDVI
jgi:S1-C subfamily serine protease